MSTESYSEWWIKSKNELGALQQLDDLTRKATKKGRSRTIAVNILGNLYGRYCLMVQHLDACLDQSCQPQKRATMRKLMDATMFRLNELRKEFLRIDLSEFHYIDGNLVELKLIPHEVEILYPALNYPRPHELQDMWDKLKKGEKIYVPPSTTSFENIGGRRKKKKLDFDPIAAMLGQTPAGEPSAVGLGVPARSSLKQPELSEEEKEPEEEKVEEKGEKKSKMRQPKRYVEEVKELTEEEKEIMRQKAIISNAVLLIQVHERARQGRLYHGDLAYVRYIRTLKKKKDRVSNSAIMEQSAMTIQTHWRGYRARSEFKKREEERRLLIRMTEPSWVSTEEQDKFKRNLEKRRELREQKYREYIKANLDEKARVLRVIGPGLMEDIGDEIREWFRIWYEEARAFDKYPDEDKGGTVLVIRGETLTPLEFLQQQMQKSREKKMSPAEKKKAKDEKLKKKKEARAKLKKEKQKAKKEALKAKKREMKGEFEFKFEDTPADKMTSNAFKEELVLWSNRPDSENPEDLPYMDMVTEDKCYDMQLELRTQVDELMRLELDQLNDALARDKKKKPKKKKKKKKKKAKGKKDLTKNRTTEDLFQELFDEGIIRKYPMRTLDEFKGDVSFRNWERRMKDFDPLQALGDVRHAVVMNCILPIGVETLPKPKSVLIAGPRQSGKHLLANAIFNATNCVLFDLSPQNMVGKYPGKKELKMLVHMVGKMSRILQPSIIFFDGAEKPFYKKVPKQEKEMEPKRLGKQIFKNFVKPLLPEDRVLVLGITGQPFAAKANGINKAFESIILIPPTDYGSVYNYWRELLMPYHGVNRNLNISALTKLTVNYPFSDLKKATETLFTVERIIALKQHPLQIRELYQLLMNKDPVTEKEFRKFLKWYVRTPLGKRRNYINKIAEKIREQEAKAAEKLMKKKK